MQPRQHGPQGASHKMLLLMALLLPWACVTTDSLKGMPPKGADRCEFIAQRLFWDDPILSLDRISLLFYNECYAETIAAGTEARDRFKHKNYSVVKETMEVFVAEGTLTDYVLESYERGYLSQMLAMSYLRQGKHNALSTELNRFYNEETAVLYNRGQDPVNAMLQAAMWENFPRQGFSARPFWLWLSRSERVADEVRGFAKARVADADAKTKQAPWRIYGLGRFPELDWSMKFEDSKTGYFTIKPKRPFTEPCVDTFGMLLPTKTWFEKIAMRHHHRYHPLVNAKSWIRLPVGVAYGVSTVVAGAGVAVGGCGLASTDESLGFLCRLAIEGGVALMAQSDDVIEAALRPDLRHWREVPEAIYISRSPTNQQGQCWQQAKQLNPTQLL